MMLNQQPFTIRGAVGDVAPMSLLFAGTVMRESMLADALRLAGMVWITAVLVLRLRAGYLRRRPYWTRESWQRFLLVCTIPVAALLLLVAFLVALEWRLPMLGPPHSSTRGLWAAASIVAMLIGAGGLAIAVFWLATGEPSRQMPWPRGHAHQPR